MTSSPFHVYFGREARAAPIELRRIEPSDALAALRQGWDDFVAIPTHPVFVGVFYVVAGFAIAALTSFADALQLVFPFAAGFALIGPFFAVGLYEMSRRREAGRTASWRDGLTIWRSPAMPSILALGLVLFLVFAAWIVAAQLIYGALFGSAPPPSFLAFLRTVLTTGQGLALIVIGGCVGFVFAAVALCLSVVSFPLMVDRDVGLVPALEASLRLARENPAAVAAWGLIVAVLLILGSLPVLIGLALVMPVLGHATWRFYRRAVVRDPAHEVPIDLPSGVDLVESPVLKPLWISLDLLDFLRKGRV